MPSKQTSTGTRQQVSAEPLAKLYDLLMEQIEPELKTESIPFLDFLYAGETPKEWTKRAERYAKAFALLEERMGLLMSAWSAQLQDYKHQALTAAKERSGKQDEQTMEDLSSAIDQA